MEFQILDGTGTGSRAQVRKQRLYTDSVSRTQSQQAILLGDGFNLSTGVITLTTDNSSALFYLKNDGEDPLIIKEIGIRASASTGGAGAALYQLQANATGGTIISNDVDAPTNFNRNLGSSKLLTGSVLKGADSNTLTGGESAGATSSAVFDDAILFDADVFVIPKGTSIGVVFTPPTGNISQTVVVFATAFYETVEIT